MVLEFLILNNKSSSEAKNLMDGIIAISDMSWVAGIIGLGLAGLTYRYVKNQSTGTEAMEGLAEQIHDGAMAFL